MKDVLESFRQSTFALTTSLISTLNVVKDGPVDLVGGGEGGGGVEEFVKKKLQSPKRA